MSGGSSGIGRRGGNSAIDEVAASRPRDWWRMLQPFDAGAAFVANTTRIRFAGQNHIGPGDASTGFGTASTFGGVSAVDRYFAIPEWFPRAGAIRRLNYLAQRATLQVAARFELHIYSSGEIASGTFQGWPYPDRLLVSGGPWTNPTAQGAAVGPTFHIYDSLLNYSLADQSLVWFVLRMNASFQLGTKWAMARGMFAPWSGMTVGAASQANDVLTQGYGWSHTTTWTNGADNTFPQTSPELLSTNPNGTIDVPAIGYGFAES